MMENVSGLGMRSGVTGKRILLPASAGVRDEEGGNAGRRAQFAAKIMACTGKSDTRVAGLA